MILITASCTKFGKNVTLKGRVVNPVTGEGIAGAEVNLYRIAGAYDSKYKTIKSATTDASGNFELDKYTWAKPVARCDVGERYKLGWTKDGGQTFIDNFELEVKKGKVTNADFYAIPYGYLKYAIKNSSCFDQFDTLFYNTKYQIPNIDHLSNTNVLNTGCIDFSNSPHIERPMGWYYFSGYFKKNNVVTTFKDSIYVTDGGYHEWIFEY
jgi:5-hydroxyisourate hydrolase-like protein (transthyretin family)